LWFFRRGARGHGAAPERRPARVFVQSGLGPVFVVRQFILILVRAGVKAAAEFPPGFGGLFVPEEAGIFLRRPLKALFPFGPVLRPAGPVDREDTEAVGTTDFGAGDLDLLGRDFESGLALAAGYDHAHL
jgi:hypothetical protein